MDKLDESKAAGNGTEEIKDDEAKTREIQWVLVTLQDGRKGMFAGPVLVGKAELTLKPPLISEVVICEPRTLAQPEEPVVVESGTEKKD